MQSQDYDIAVIGGGINGAGIARDAAGRGYRIVLVEQDDLASHTSSASSKLIHGGLRYLEFYEFKLVHEALSEREVLLNIAPHIIWPLRFVMPHRPEMRPAWMIRIGLWLYDHLGKRKKLPGSKGLDLVRHACGKALKSRYKKGFIYSDCWAQDARLVVLNALDALNHGADVLPRTRCVSASANEQGWTIELEDSGKNNRQIKAKMLVNATGPWVGEFLDKRIKLKHDHSIRLVSGSHIVVPKLFDHDMAYIFQNTDGRIVFAIPYESGFTLIGTTERDVETTCPQGITAEEIDYLCASVNEYFEQQITPQDVVWNYSGVRPLLQDSSEDATSTTREYYLDMQPHPAPCLSVFGGKITTYRSLSEHALRLIDESFSRTSVPWTADKPLPGGDFMDADFDRYLDDFRADRLWLPEDLARHYVRNYGTRAKMICNSDSTLEALGQDYGNGLYQAEIDYLVDHEWVRTAEDLLWRRSKWGLHLDDTGRQAVAEYIDQKIKGLVL